MIAAKVRTVIRIVTHTVNHVVTVKWQISMFNVQLECARDIAFHVFQYGGQ